MQINQRQAEDIVITLKSVIEEDINIISPEGSIIASSDPLRIGQFHEGAKVVSETLKPLIITSDDLYQGTKKGINLPVFYDDVLVAIVGVTGESKALIQSSHVIVKMSEILIKEQFLNKQKQFRRENQRVLIEMMMDTHMNPELLGTKMQELGYDVSSYKYVILFDFQPLDVEKLDDINNMYMSIEKRVSSNDLLARHDNTFVLVTHLNDLDGLMNQIKSIKNHLESKYKVKLTIGISEVMQSAFDYAHAYQQASMVIELGTNKHSGSIKMYDRTSLDLLFQGFSHYIKLDFSSHVFRHMTKDEIEDAKIALLAYIRHNGSIQKASEELFIHKNTMQYRLNRIHQKTGYNPRELEGMISLYLAVQLQKKN